MMNARNRQPLIRCCFALVLLTGAFACDSGEKQIGALDGATTTTNDGSDDEDEGDPTDGCTDGGQPETCAEPQNVEIDFRLEPLAEDSYRLSCAANTDTTDTGYVVTLTNCADVYDQPQADRELYLDGDWPDPGLSDGEHALTDVQVIRRAVEDSNQLAMHAVILRSRLDGEVSLIAMHATAMLLEPSDVAPLYIRLDDAGCALDLDSCESVPQGVQYPIGFLIRYGCSEAIVADDTRIDQFGVEQGTGISYEVLVGFASEHECNPDGDFHELQLGVVGVEP